MLRSAIIAKHVLECKGISFYLDYMLPLDGPSISGFDICSCHVHICYTISSLIGILNIG